MKSENFFKAALKENLIKNLLAILAALLSYGFIYSSLRAIYADQAGNLLNVISMLLVTVCFANFAFSYEHVDFDKMKFRFLAHLATFIFMLLIAVFLETIVAIVGIQYPSFAPVAFWFAILLYLGVALFDFWDFFRVFKIKN